MLALTVRRVSALVLFALVLVSATSCAQVLGIDKEYKKGRTAPEGWLCPVDYYDERGAGKKAGKDSRCDCECGIFDLDCEESTVAVINHLGEDGSVEAEGIDDPKCRSCDPKEATCSTLSN